MKSSLNPARRPTNWPTSQPQWTVAPISPPSYQTISTSIASLLNTKRRMVSLRAIRTLSCPFGAANRQQRAVWRSCIKHASGTSNKSCSGGGLRFGWWGLVMRLVPSDVRNKFRRLKTKLPANKTKNMVTDWHGITEIKLFKPAHRPCFGRLRPHFVKTGQVENMLQTSLKIVLCDSVKFQVHVSVQHLYTNSSNCFNNIRAKKMNFWRWQLNVLCSAGE